MRDSSGSFKELSFYGYSFPQGLIPLYMHILYFPIFSQIMFFPCADYCIKIFFRRYFVTGIFNILFLLCCCTALLSPQKKCSVFMIFKATAGILGEKDANTSTSMAPQSQACWGASGGWLSGGLAIGSGGN